MSRRLTLAVLCLLLPASSIAMKLVHTERSLYRQVLVYEDAGVRYLCFTRNCTIGRQSALDLGNRERLVFEYAHMMMGALFLKPEPRSVLVIGLGGGSLPRALGSLLSTAVIDVVEIDPAVTRVAQRYFDFTGSDRVSVFEQDGRTYVRRALRDGKHYDLVMLDAYDHEYIPEHLLTVEFLRQVQQLLTPDGVLAANTFSSSRLYDNESVTYRAVFGDFYNLKSGNRIILYQNGGLPAEEELRRNSTAFAASFRRFGFGVEELLPMFSTALDWNTSARVLTDQYSPANLLNAQP